MSTTPATGSSRTKYRLFHPLCPGTSGYMLCHYTNGCYCSSTAADWSAEHDTFTGVGATSTVTAAAASTGSVFKHTWAAYATTANTSISHRTVSVSTTNYHGDSVTACFGIWAAITAAADGGQWFRESGNTAALDTTAWKHYSYTNSKGHCCSGTNRTIDNRPGATVASAANSEHPRFHRTNPARAVATAKQRHRQFGCTTPISVSCAHATRPDNIFHGSKSADPSFASGFIIRSNCFTLTTDYSLEFSPSGKHSSHTITAASGVRITVGHCWYRLNYIQWYAAADGHGDGTQYISSSCTANCSRLKWYHAAGCSFATTISG